MVRIVAWRSSPYDNRSYLLVDERREAVLIDPAMDERNAMDAVRQQDLRLVEILNTHGHPDHIYANAAVKAATGARLAIQRLDAYRLGPKAPPTPIEVPPCDPDDLFDEGPLGYVADLTVIALHTPGHTEGSTCFHLPGDNVLFSGDLLFKGNVGRWDQPGGDIAAHQRSLARVATTLPPQTRVYPGHGAPTTIGAEIVTLRALRDAGVLPDLRIA